MRRGSITAILTALTLFVLGMPAAAAQHTYRTYYNARFDFSILIRQMSSFRRANRKTAMDRSAGRETAAPRCLCMARITP
jgi:hypothetical protein